MSVWSISNLRCNDSTVRIRFLYCGCVAVCCSVLQCVAGRAKVETVQERVIMHVLRRGAACCSEVQRVAARCSVLPRGAACCSEWQCVRCRV